MMCVKLPIVLYVSLYASGILDQLSSFPALACVNSQENQIFLSHSIPKLAPPSSHTLTSFSVCMMCPVCFTVSIDGAPHDGCVYTTGHRFLLSQLPKCVIYPNGNSFCNGYQKYSMWSWQERQMQCLNIWINSLLQSKISRMLIYIRK